MANVRKKKVRVTPRTAALQIIGIEQWLLKQDDSGKLCATIRENGKVRSVERDEFLVLATETIVSMITTRPTLKQRQIARYRAERVWEELVKINELTMFLERNKRSNEKS
jgi:hypothetical protein